MHLEILVEDKSGEIALENLVPKIIGEEHTFKIHSYKGIGKIPKNLRLEENPSSRILLQRLPSVLRGYGKSFVPDFPSAVVVVCDLDDKCLKTFRKDLDDLLQHCSPQPESAFCIAVEEGEAWLLGDKEAIRSAFPNAKESVLRGYSNDSVCGTWECLADALYPGGAKKLRNKGWQAVGFEKAVWASKISPVMDVERNVSPSFVYFRDRLRSLLAGPTAGPRSRGM